MFPWMLDMAAPLPLPRAPGQLRAPLPAKADARVGGGGAPPGPAAHPHDDNAAPGVMTPRAALLLGLVMPSVLHRLSSRKAEDAEGDTCFPLTGLRG